jgi:hypothetical protein
MSGLAALIGFVTRQWLRYQRQSLKYQKELTENIYFRNVNNNAGIFDYMIGAAEEQDCKEAFLAYYFLRTAGAAATEAKLEDRIELWLKEAFGVDIEFGVAYALAKLDRLGLVRREADRLAALAPQDTIARLDSIWADFFRYDKTSIVSRSYAGFGWRTVRRVGSTVCNPTLEDQDV